MLDDTVHGGQPQSGALSHLLGGEERLEEVIKDFFVHAAAVIAHGEHHIFTAGKTRVNGAIGLIEGGVFGLDGDLAHPGDGVPGVDAKIRQKLVDLGGVNLDRPQARSRHPDEINVLADQPQQHLEHARHGVV